MYCYYNISTILYLLLTNYKLFLQNLKKLDPQKTNLNKTIFNLNRTLYFFINNIFIVFICGNIFIHNRGWLQLLSSVTKLKFCIRIDKLNFFF